MKSERRKVARYLCSDDFSDSVIAVEGLQLSLISVNYNRFGIATFSDERLPVLSQLDNPVELVISFQIDIEDKTVAIEKLTCRIANRHETDVGQQYGIQFLYNKEKDTALLDSLIAIEKHVAEQSSSENRYGLF